MITKIKMTMELLNLIVLIKAYNQYKRDEIRIFGNINKDDPYYETQKYYNNLPNVLLEKYGLSKNNYSFEKVIDYPITKELLNTEECELGKFDF